MIAEGHFHCHPAARKQSAAVYKSLILQTCEAWVPVNASCRVTRAAPTAVLPNDLADAHTSLSGSSAPGRTAPSICTRCDLQGSKRSTAGRDTCMSLQDSLVLGFQAQCLHELRASQQLLRKQQQPLPG